MPQTSPAGDQPHMLVTLSGYGVALTGRCPWRASRVACRPRSEVPADTLLVEATDAEGGSQHLLIVPGAPSTDAGRRDRPEHPNAVYASGATLLRGAATFGFDDFGWLADGPAEPHWNIQVDDVQVRLPPAYGFNVVASSLAGLRLQPSSIGDRDAAVTFSGPFDRRFMPPLMSFVAGHQKVVSAGEEPAQGLTWIDVTHQDAHRSWWQRIGCITVNEERCVVVRAQAAPQDVEVHVRGVLELAASIRTADPDGRAGREASR